MLRLRQAVLPSQLVRRVAARQRTRLQSLLWQPRNQQVCTEEA